MLKFIFSCFYFFLPAYFTNMIPSITASLNVFNSFGKPIDNNKQFKGKPLLGNHKTWRGLILGPIAGILILFIQKWLFNNCVSVREISLLNYQEIGLCFGFLMVFGTVFGDLFFAFIKRRLDLKPGAKFMPFDQINYVLGAGFFLNLFSEIKIDFKVWTMPLVLTFVLHIAATQIGFKMGLSKNKW